MANCLEYDANSTCVACKPNFYLVTNAQTNAITCEAVPEIAKVVDCVHYNRDKTCRHCVKSKFYHKEKMACVALPGDITKCEHYQQNDKDGTQIHCHKCTTDYISDAVSCVPKDLQYTLIPDCFTQVG